MRWSVVIAIILSIALRVLILGQVAVPTFDSYQHLTYAQNILETGLPVYEDNTSWLGAEYDYAPLFHYIIAFLGIFIPLEYAGLVLINLFSLAIPILVYKLTQHLSTHQYAPDITALMSSAAPLLYQFTVLDVTPFALALPLILLTLHAFIGTIRNPQKQNFLLLSATALALTSPMGLILAAGLLLALIIRKVQHEKLPQRSTEATLFITFSGLWAALVFFKDSIQAHGLNTFWLQPNTVPELATLVTQVGVLTVIAGSYSAYNYFTEQHNPRAYPILGIVLAITITLFTGILRAEYAIILLSLLLLPLCARFINIYTQQRYRSRIPKLYHVGTVLLVLLLLVTHAVPAITHATKATTQTPTQQQLELVQSLHPSNDVYLWTQETGFLLQYYGHNTLITNNLYASTESIEILEQVQTLQAANPIQYIETLSALGVDRVITTVQDAPQNDRCFSTLYTSTQYEVNKRECVIESRTA